MRGALSDLLIFDGGPDEEFRVWAGGVSVNRTLFEFLKRRNIVSGRALVSFLRATPDALWALGWGPKDRREFTAMVLWKLRNFYPIGTFVKRKPVKHAYGATLPTWLQHPESD